MHVVIARPREDAVSLVKQLSNRSLDSIIAPMIDITYLDNTAVQLDGVQALLFTSANGARAFARASLSRELPVLAVGDATARMARNLGFDQVLSANGDVTDLAKLAIQECRFQAGCLLHPAGSHVAGDLAGLLAEGSLSYRRIVLYRADQVGVLPEAVRDGLEMGRIAGIVLYSPRSGRIFSNLVSKAGLIDRLRAVMVYCLSVNVADSIAGLPWAMIKIAPTPNEMAVLALFEG
ncbi:MAG: hypothetical protein CBB68_06320 [Rhodospirillaceae bacterium TMED8]|nr:uroporphyrinogen-III synthase [Magnetovibrio sp.]OUT51235.1 MAG: hypothetical protein CBB68_06320 [Rhodospirillaceae bacterium TMED8]